MSWLAWTAVAFASPPAAMVFSWRQDQPWRYYRAWAVFSAVFTLLYAAMQGWPSMAGNAASLVVALILWWRSRRRRKRAPRAYGDKARARIAAIARRMPRVAPRLQPQGPRA